MRMSRIIRVSHAAFALQISSGHVIGVTFAVQTVRPAGDARAGETIQRVVAEGLRLRVDGIRDRVDVAHCIVRVGIFLQASRRKNFQPSALLVPGVIGVGGVECVRAAHQLNHAHGRIIGDGLRVRVRAGHARGKHVGIICEVDDLAIGIHHRGGQVGGVVGEISDRLLAKNISLF